MIHLVLWKWAQAGQRFAYTPEHVNVMAAMLKRNIKAKLKYRIICITDGPEGITECETFPLWDDLAELPNPSRRAGPSCFRRLKLYDPKTQAALGIKPGDRIVGLDIDTLVINDISDLLETKGRFIGWGMPSRAGDAVLNGSLQMFEAGDLQELWSTFDPQVSPNETFHLGWLGSDQAWISRHLAGKEGTVGLGWPDIASYPLQVKIQGLNSARTKLMFFHGSVKPWDPQALRDTPWVARYWRM